MQFYDKFLKSSISELVSAVIVSRAISVPRKIVAIYSFSFIIDNLLCSRLINYYFFILKIFTGSQ